MRTIYIFFEKQSPNIYWMYLLSRNSHCIHLQTIIEFRSVSHIHYILFYNRLLDTGVPGSIRSVILELLNEEASLLLPPLHERMELLHRLLPKTNIDWDSLSQGQVNFNIVTILLSRMAICFDALLLEFCPWYYDIGF